jgi:hypothetical protein
MALLDVSLVTQTLMTLVREHVGASPAWTLVQPPTISPHPPDRLTGTNVIGLYLYHLCEDAHYKNLPSPGNDQPPIRSTPMALDLSYQLTAHHDSDSDTDTFQEQLMLGLAMKALRDHPCIHDGTRINGVQILHANLRGDDNRFRISLQPVTGSEAVSYWTAGTSALRLAAYYHVSVVLLEPEPSTSRAARVLAYGIQTFTRGAPRLEGSRNRLAVRPPGATEDRIVELRPAQVPYGGRVEFIGADLAGDETGLLLGHPRWAEPVAVDAAWGVMATADRATAVARATAGAEAVLPGVYAAFVRVTTLRSLPGGQPRAFEQTSNVTPFMVTARIDAVGVPDAAGVFTVDGELFAHPELPAGAVQVFVGAARLGAGAAGALAAGEFAVVDAAHLEVRLPAGAIPGLPLPLRVLIDGAESPPRWVTPS